MGRIYSFCDLYIQVEPSWAVGMDSLGCRARARCLQLELRISFVWAMEHSEHDDAELVTVAALLQKLPPLPSVLNQSDPSSKSTSQSPRSNSNSRLNDTKSDTGKRKIVSCLDCHSRKVKVSDRGLHTAPSLMLIVFNPFSLPSPARSLGVDCSHLGVDHIRSVQRLDRFVNNVSNEENKIHAFTNWQRTMKSTNGYLLPNELKLLHPDHRGHQSNLA